MPGNLTRVLERVDGIDVVIAPDCLIRKLPETPARSLRRASRRQNSAEQALNAATYIGLAAASINAICKDVVTGERFYFWLLLDTASAFLAKRLWVGFAKGQAKPTATMNGQRMAKTLKGN